MQSIRPVEIFRMDQQSAYIVTSLSITERCVRRLVREGYTVLSVHVEFRNPVIEIENCGRCARLDGAMMTRACTPRGREQLMVAIIDGCQVQWRVRGNFT